MNTIDLERILKEVGEKDARNKQLEVENELLRVQNTEMIRMVFQAKEILEEKGII